jgi:proline iminopeptidase
VVSLVLRGIFLCRKLEIDWFYQSGCSYLFPDAWEKFIAPIPPEERGDLVSAYHRRLTGADESARLACAKAWSIWEATTSRLLIDEAAIAEYEDPYKALPFAGIENHYFFNHAFFESDRFLLDGARQIDHLPTRIIQGRYDVVCPATSAWDLHKAMPSADLRISPSSGHSAFEAENLSELVQATDDFRSLF